MINVCSKMFRCTTCVLRRCVPSFTKQPSVPVAGYKSIYNLDNLYPGKSLVSSEFSSKPNNDNSESFTGHIPIDQLQIKYSRSGGPGGQNVNKVNTKVEVRVHVETATWIPEKARSRLAEQQRTSITKNGFLLVTSDKTRRQMLNQADCLEKLRTMVRKAASQPTEPTQEQLQQQASRQEKARRLMLQEKRSHSLKKQQRQKPMNGSL